MGYDQKKLRVRNGMWSEETELLNISDYQTEPRQT